jgi:hypothetical protein
MATPLETVFNAWDQFEEEVVDMVDGLKDDREADPKALAIIRTVLKSMEEGGEFASRWMQRWGDVKRQVAQFQGEIGAPDLEAKFEQLKKLIGAYGQ